MAHNPVKFLGRRSGPDDIYSSIKYKRDFRRDHPEYFDPDGILIFCGPQGAGKTLSAVAYVRRLAQAYPQAIICSNVDLHGFPGADRICRYRSIADLTDISNGYAGVIYLIDEIHVLFNSLESKNIDYSVMQEICQQRKQRKHIVGTAQVFQRLAKPFREQFKYAVLCRCFGGVLQYNTLIDGARSVEGADGRIKCDNVKHYFWFHTPELYASYDTYAKIERE